MCVRGCDSSKKAECRVTWGGQVLRSPNLFYKNYPPQEAENAVISQCNHPVDTHIFHNAHATIAWPQQTLLQETLELERTTYDFIRKVNYEGTSDSITARKFNPNLRENVAQQFLHRYTATTMTAMILVTVNIRRPSAVHHTASSIASRSDNVH